MNYPDFFNQVPTITMYDSLSKQLGDVDMALHGIKALYKDDLPIRVDIIVTCKEKREHL